MCYRPIKCQGKSFLALTPQVQLGMKMFRLKCAGQGFGIIDGDLTHAHLGINIAYI
jgi:uncharacterized protein (AIM24 family)